MGNVLGVVDGTGTLSGTARYSAFGERRSVGAGVTTANAGGGFALHGMWLDEITGLYYVRARSYDPQTGRFLTRDPITGIRSRPSTFHPYSFAHSNPHLYRDPLGEFGLIEVMLVLVIVAELYALGTGKFLGLLGGGRGGPWFYTYTGDTVVPLHRNVGVGSKSKLDLSIGFSQSGVDLFNAPGNINERDPSDDPFLIHSLRKVTRREQLEIEQYFYSLLRAQELRQIETPTYDLYYSNCIHFAEAIFDYVSERLHAGLPLEYGYLPGFAKMAAERAPTRGITGAGTIPGTSP